MKKLEVLGAGCPKCLQLAEMTRQAAEELGIEFELIKVTDLDAIIDFGVMITPALVVDGIVKVAGKVPALDTLKSMIQ